MGDWGLGPIPNPQSPIPNPQSPLFLLLNKSDPEFNIESLLNKKYEK